MKKMILLVWALACAAVFGQAISFNLNSSVGLFPDAAFAV